MHECIVVRILIIVNYYVPYKNTFADMLKAPVDDPKSLFFRMCFYMVRLAGVAPARRQANDFESFVSAVPP